MDVKLQEKHHESQHKTVDIHVHYIAARNRFVEKHAPWHEELKTLKARVLDFFELVEGSVEGGTKSYWFALNEVQLSNLNETLGALVEKQEKQEKQEKHEHHHEQHEMKLVLIERFEQGY